MVHDTSIQPFYWDRVRDTTVGRYLSGRELAFVKRFLRTGDRPCDLLDIGCGSGRMTLPLHDASLRIVGVDINLVALAELRRRSDAIPPVMADAVQLPFADNSFDYVTAIQCFEFFEHQQFFRECQRVLRNGGTLIFDALNRHSYKWPLKMLLRRTLDLPSANLSCREVIHATIDQGFDILATNGYNWLPFGRGSDSPLVGPTALLEQTLHLDRYYTISPKILVAARKRCRGDGKRGGL